MASQLSSSGSQLAVQLHDIGCVKFGQFKLKSGLISPIYIDLRLLVSYPAILRDVAKAMARQLDVMQPELAMPESRSTATGRQTAIVFDRLAAIPYAGLPIGVAVALEIDKPLIYTRKEAKDYGTAKLIEGEYFPGETVLLVDDLITKGTSKIESLQPLLDARLSVTDVLVLIDREQGGGEELATHGVALHAVMTLSQMLHELVTAERLSAKQRDEVLTWITTN